MIIEGYLATHSKKPYLGNITISDKTGLITKVSKGTNKNSDKKFSKDCLIFPGMGDVHIHAREDETGKQVYKEDYTTAGDAALNGGCVHISAMPNTPNPVTSSARFKWHRDRVKKIGHSVSILNYIGIDSKTKPIGKPGEHMYKCFFGKSVGDLTIMYGSDLDKALSRYKKHFISFHVEYELVVLASTQGKTHSDRRPVACVNEGLRILLPLIEKYKINAKLCHWSTGGESFEMIKEYQDRGCNITLEVSPLHLLFDTSMTDKDPGLWLKIQMNPAIQSVFHRNALLKALKEGFIHYIATDHAPHTEEEKHSAFKGCLEGDTKSNIETANTIKKKSVLKYNEISERNGVSGAPWLDVYAFVCIHLMKKHGFTSQDIARVSAYNPGKFVNQFLKKQFSGVVFGKGFGDIEKGYVGSLTVINTKKKTKVTKAILKTKTNWSPLEGKEFSGCLESVVVRGKVY